MRISDWSSDVCSSDLFEPEEPERGGGGAHPHTAAVGGPGTARESFERCGLFEQFCSAFDELFAFAGQANAARSALENLDAEIVFENLDAARERRLGDVERRRSLGESALSRDLNDMVHLAQIQHFALRLSRPRTSPSIKDIGQVGPTWAGSTRALARRRRRNTRSQMGQRSEARRVGEEGVSKSR